MTANSIPLFNILMSTFKLRWKPAVIVGSIIAFFGDAVVVRARARTPYFDYMQAWAGNYGILLGPIAGLMIANYWVVRKQKIDMQRLYTKGSGGVLVPERLEHRRLRVAGADVGALLRDRVPDQPRWRTSPSGR